MVKKQPIRKRMKLVIHALREGKKTWSELEKLGIPEKTLDRILKEYLAEWGLVRKENDYWVWYENARVFHSGQEYNIAIEHSRKLLPALQNMLRINVKDRHIFYSAAKEHLRSYPEIYCRLEAFEEAFTQRIRELFEKYGRYIMTADQFMVWDPVQVKGKGFLGKFLSQTEFIKRDLPYVIKFPDHPEIKNPNEFMKTKEYEEIDELRDFLDNTKAFSERFALYGELSGEIAVLSLRAEMGTPLEGKCSLCPNVTIKEKEGVEP